MTNFPLIKWSIRHPRIAAWLVLSVGMVALLVIEARDVGLQTGNWIALIIATVLVAGACIWIISWEDGDETQPDPNIKTKTGEMQKVVLPKESAPADDVHRLVTTQATANALTDDDRKRDMTMDAHATEADSDTATEADSAPSSDMGVSADSGSGGDAGGGTSD